jgi:GNAT superfamily N-acetyltransferase
MTTSTSSSARTRRLQAIDTVRTYLARDRGALVGYVALLADAIVLESRERTRLALTHGDHPVIPAIKVARLAVAEGYRARHAGSGRALMRFAFAVALDVSDRIGCRVLTVDAYPAAVGFYDRLGFVRNRSREYRGRARPSMRLDLRADPLPGWTQGT